MKLPRSRKLGLLHVAVNAVEDLSAKGCLVQAASQGEALLLAQLQENNPSVR